MDYLQFTALRNGAKEYFDEVEKGKSFIVVRKGRPIAKVIPFKEPIQGWKREIKRIKLKRGVETGKILRKIRDEE